MRAPFPEPQCCAACGTHYPCREHQVLIPIPPCCGLTLHSLPAGPDCVVAEGEAWDCSQCWFGALTQLGSSGSASTGLGEAVSSAEVACPGRIPPRDQHCLALSWTRALNFLHSLFWDIKKATGGVGW